VKVFISSVRRGLEEERDALPGLIQALGHEPRRFEDFTAQSVPSRQACLDGIEAADVYVLLIGEHYGDSLPETGKARLRRSSPLRNDAASRSGSSGSAASRWSRNKRRSSSE